MRYINLSEEANQITADNSSPTVYLTVGSKTESHLRCGKQTQKSDISGTIDIHTKIDCDHVLVDFSERLFDYFKIAIGTFSSKAGIHLDYTFIGETVQMVFLLKGNATTLMLEKSFLFKGNECNIFFGIETKGISILKEGENTFFLIDIQKEFFVRYLPKYKQFEDFGLQIEDQRSGFLKSENVPITPEMLLLIKEIMDCKRTDHFRKIHMHSKVMELLLLQLDLLKLDPKPAEAVSACNLAKMEIARKYLSENYRDPMTLKELSKNIGTNEFLLKRDFKILFGNTVFGYVAELRMEKAKTMLVKGEFTVSQIADEVGYKNPQHFSTAFKRKFGISPSSIRINS